MKTVMILAAFGAALVVACLLATAYHGAMDEVEVTQSDACCPSPAFPFSDAATWVAKVRHDNCISGRPEDQSNMDMRSGHA